MMGPSATSLAWCTSGRLAIEHFGDDDAVIESERGNQRA
jgi:hypothetical protein